MRRYIVFNDDPNLEYRFPGRGRKLAELKSRYSHQNLEYRFPGRGRKPITVLVKSRNFCIWNIDSPGGDGNEKIDGDMVRFICKVVIRIGWKFDENSISRGDINSD